jgi:hypothetical protein
MKNVAALCTLITLFSCAWTPRVVALKHPDYVTKYMSIPELNGLRVHVAEVLDTRNPNESWDAVPSTEKPKGFFYISASRAEEAAWRSELESGSLDQPRHAIGLVRNLNGAATSSVSSVNSPVDWLRDALQTELKGHGAVLVDQQEADMTVQMNLRSFRADLYYVTSAAIAAEVRLTPRPGAGEPRTVRLHTRDTTVAWEASSWEYYESMRGAQQQLLTHVLLLTAGGPAPEAERPRDEPAGYWTQDGFVRYPR